MENIEDKIIVNKIESLKKSKNAVILAHNYQLLEVQRIADFVGDSLQLAQKAKEIKADIIVFAGVRFMAETAKLLNPKVKVLLASESAGCPMADMIEPFQLQEFKAKNPEYLVVCYVNSSIEVKAESDVCVTSSNAVKIVESLDKNRPILFVPDQNLGNYTQMKSQRDIKVWEGMCPIHHFIFSTNDIKRMREKYPDHTIIVHPECQLNVIKEADFASSTKGMADFVAENDKVILGTEVGLVEALQDKYPQKSILPLSNMAVCIDMKKTTIEEILNTLEQEQNEIIIEPEIAKKAASAIDNMLKFSK
ncbi:MAG: quinolinate synthase NadA [Candidatus Cloacimonadales bacterium]|nr:quinolinate synthase NadA [Candidatus Cloacimonadota bacterium]MDD2650085.1 quinolinate synthase NadA [Candidatus Cloacimonadota bacterium]MDD3501089.1 quinolinate synthase NadA [Candidatus Cloacimonadota bacterium]MDX9976742.1 quinolinate synthase NadA [Candidatus Cloacimonadales bacterium]